MTSASIAHFEPPPWPSELRPLIEDALNRFLPAANQQPESLHRAMRYAVFAGRKRLRSQFLLKVAQACGAGKAEQDLALRAACAVELIHVASLVHDDLPCFDNAAQRRGQPTVHVVFGEACALLVGNALLARSFELLAATPRALSSRAIRVVQLLAAATGSQSGLVGGQATEQDSAVGTLSPESAASYYEMKTGVLFSMAAEAAAVVSGAKNTAEWAGIGWLVGRGYQLAHTLQEAARVHSHAADTQEQLRLLLASLHARIAGLAVTPTPLVAFLNDLCTPLLLSQPTVSNVSQDQNVEALEAETPHV